MSKKMTLERLLDRLPAISALLILFLGIYVALFPVAYTPISKAVLFTLVAALPGLLFGTNVAAKLKLGLKGFTISAAGIAGFFLALILILDIVASPDTVISGFRIYDSTGNQVNLRHDLVRLNPPRGLNIPEYYIDETENLLIIVFPEQVPEISIEVQEFTGGKVWRGTVSWTGSITDEPLVLGRDLK